MAPAPENSVFQKKTWARDRKNGAVVVGLLLEAPFTEQARAYITRAKTVLHDQFTGDKLGLDTPALTLTPSLLPG